MAEPWPDKTTTHSSTISIKTKEFGELHGFSLRDYFHDDEVLAWQITTANPTTQIEKPGVLVYISPSPSGAMPEDWKRLLHEKNLIWVSADNSGNDVSTQRRIVQAIFGLHLLQKSHAINMQRIYLAGFSGGARVATIMAPHFTKLFSGAIFIGGANQINFDASKDLNLQNSRYIFIIGDQDFNLNESKVVFEKLKHDVRAQSHFIKIPGFRHQLPPSQWLAKALDKLDQGGKQK